MHSFLRRHRERKEKLRVDDRLRGSIPSFGGSLGETPILSKPLDHEELYLYLAVSQHAISAALIREENRVQ